MRRSGLTEPCRLRPVAILETDGLAVEVKSWPLEIYGDYELRRHGSIYYAVTRERQD